MKNDCNIIRDILPLYAEDMVSADTSAFVEEHLTKCAECRAELENLKSECSNIEFGGDDITKILVKSKKLTGDELSEKLYMDFGIEDERNNSKSVLLLCGIGTSYKKLLRLQKALLKM